MSFTLNDFEYIDSHCHFFPPQIFKSIWNYFELPDKEGNPQGWHIKYKLPTEDLITILKSHNIKHFTTLNYAHKPSIAEYINDWTFNFVKKYQQRFGRIPDLYAANGYDAIYLIKIAIDRGGYNAEEIKKALYGIKN